jgi:hypothetical protein
MLKEINCTCLDGLGTREIVPEMSKQDVEAPIETHDAFSSGTINEV